MSVTIRIELVVQFRMDMTCTQKLKGYNNTRMGDRGSRDSPRKTCHCSPLLWLHCQVSHNPSSMQRDEAEQNKQSSSNIHS